ncbi:FAD-dependent oxidoreductase [Sphingobium sp. AN641]|uniref:oxidoreductase n=1 Tax=Sphingobium sp. AN641 TaxID=3133443 RepID=UPI0030BAB932
MVYTHVDKPIRLGNVEIKNRTFRPAHGTGIGWGAMTEPLIAYHEERARGGIGLIINEIGSVHESTAFNLDIFKPEIEDGMRAFAERLQRHGTKVFQQLWHAGAAFGPRDGSPPWSASDIANVANGIVPTPMTKGMIDEIIGAYAQCAQRMEQYGLDGVDIHGAHGYLPAQFFSPNSNKREDEYGGSFENRARFIMELMRAVRGAVSKDFVVGIRVGTDLIENGLSIDDYLKLTHMLEAEGLIDYVNLSVGSYNRNDKMIGGMNEPVGYELPTSIPITHNVNVPTLVTGRFRTLEECDQVIRAGDADMVGLVRATIADPQLVAKSLAGQADRVRPCIACNQSCVTRQMFGLPIECAVNAGAGHELERGDHLLVAAPEARKLLVVGGGPAGLEAARVAALRGHKVTLVEANSHLGGSMVAAAKAPTRHQLIDIVTWLEEEVYRLGVDVQLSTYVDADDVLAMGADAIIVATGSMERMDGMQVSHPGEPISGVDRKGVISSTELFLMTPADLGQSAVIIDDVGHYEGLGSAEFLINQGLSVTYVTPKREIAPHIWPTLMLDPFLQRMQGKPFRYMDRTRGIAIEDGQVVVGPAHLQGTLQDSTILPADSVVLVSGNRQIRDVFDGLRDRMPEIRIVGDASSPRFVQTAIREGHVAGAAV